MGLRAQADLAEGEPKVTVGQLDLVTVEDERARLLAQLHAVGDELYEILFQPAPAAFDQRGNILRDDGVPVRDYSGKISASIAFMRYSEQIRKVAGLDAEPTYEQHAAASRQEAVDHILRLAGKAA